MNDKSTKRKKRYFLVLPFLLLLLLFGLIAWLTFTILTMRVDAPDLITGLPASPQPTARRTLPTHGAVDRVVIQLEDEPLDKTVDAIDERAEHAVAEPPPVLAATTALCDTFSSEIRQRDAFPNPLPISIVATPTRVDIEFNIQPSSP